MINILIPMAGRNQHFPEKDFPYPLPLIEIGSKTIIELLIENLSKVDKNVHFIFIKDIGRSILTQTSTFSQQIPTFVTVKSRGGNVKSALIHKCGRDSE